MTLENLLAGVECVSVAGEPTLEICGVTNDSRRVEPGWCFIAVRGYETDGHRFIPAALARGAALIVAEEPVEGAASAVVQDSRRAEALIAANFYGRPAEKLRMVGITGTNGKTTTTNLIRAILLKATGRPIGLIGTNRNIVGDAEEEAQRTTPDSIELQALLARMVAAGAVYCVMEVSSHALYLNRTAGVHFAAGAFTNLTEDHLDFHKTMEAYAAAKSILFTQCDTAVVNLDDPWADTMLDAARCPALTFSAQGKAASLAAREIVLRADGVAFDLVHEGAAHRVTLGIPGLFSVYNALCALGVTTALGVPLPVAIAALGETGGVKGRAEVVPTGREFTVLIDYAHSPDAMENILNTVRGFARGRVLLLFGCGGDREREKRPVMGKIAVEMADYVFITSDNPRTEVPGDIIREILAGVGETNTPYRVIENRREAIAAALAECGKDDVLILAGKGHETYQILGKEKHHFDEREEVARWLRDTQEG